MPDLSEFQDAFSIALRGDGAPLAPWLHAAPSEIDGLLVYRNTVARGAVDALIATYTTVASMVGDSWFRAAAGAYAEEHRPSQPSLLSYGADFPGWLSRFPPADDTPYLPGIARLDRLWWESYFAADGERLDASAFAGLDDASALSEVTVRLHPSVRLASLEQNLMSLWLSHRDPDRTPSAFQIDDDPEYALMVRTGVDVQARLLNSSEFEFLLGCAEGESLLKSAERAVDADPRASLPDIVAASLTGGVLSRLERLGPGPSR